MLAFKDCDDSEPGKRVMTVINAFRGYMVTNNAQASHRAKLARERAEGAADAQQSSTKTLVWSRDALCDHDHFKKFVTQHVAISEAVSALSRLVVDLSCVCVLCVRALYLPNNANSCRNSSPRTCLWNEQVRPLKPSNRLASAR